MVGVMQGRLGVHCATADPPIFSVGEVDDSQGLYDQLNTKEWTLMLIDHLNDTACQVALKVWSELI